MEKRIGFLVNPVAGMGGSVGLKGTDGEIYQKALQLGAKPVTPTRTMEFLSHIRSKDDIELFVAPGKTSALSDDNRAIVQVLRELL